MPLFHIAGLNPGDHITLCSELCRVDPATCPWYGHALPAATADEKLNMHIIF